MQACKWYVSHAVAVNYSDHPVVGRGVLLIGRGLDGRADGWDIREEGDVGGFGGTRALFVPGNIR